MPISIKICGMADPDNIQAVEQLKPDYMGFIFYKKSPRYAGKLKPEVLHALSSEITKVGVFVNETVEAILSTVETYRLNAVQLHGNESPEDCLFIKSKGIKVIKAISIADKEDIDAAGKYIDTCNYFLFDTKTALYGGSGKQYDWSILNDYTNSCPFFLSGGIGAEDAARIRSFVNPQLFALDINSKFEIRPGLKDTATLEKFIATIRTKNS